jgi:catechol 2,3-dioxygenase-like lactoylglutathione lyase family enzyme
MKLEVITLPVSDVDRATAFYRRLGWRQDVTPPGSGIVQFTSPASGCSIQFGRDRTSATPGSAEGLYLIVSDVVAARESLLGADIEVSEVFRPGADGPVSGPAPERHSYGSFVSFSDPDGNRWLLQEVTTRLPGRVDPAATSFGSASDLEAALIRAAMAHGEHEKRIGGRIRRELADLVRRRHGGRAGRRGAADVNTSIETRKKSL